MLPLPPPPAAKPNKDHRALYTAFCEALGYKNPTAIERGRINAAIRDLPDDATPDQIRRRTAIFLRESGLKFVGPQGIVGNWSRLAEIDKPRPTPQPSERLRPADPSEWTPIPDDVRAQMRASLGLPPVTTQDAQTTDDDPTDGRPA